MDLWHAKVGEHSNSWAPEPSGTEIRPSAMKPAACVTDPVASVKVVFRSTCTVFRCLSQPFQRNIKKILRGSALHYSSDADEISTDFLYDWLPPGVESQLGVSSMTVVSAITNTAGRHVEIARQ